MFDLSDPQTYWLNVTNLILGFVTLVCVIVIGVTVFRELYARARSRVPVFAQRDDHAFFLPDLGITMADGGEKIDENKLRSSVHHPDSADEKNIYRSNN